MTKGGTGEATAERALILSAAKDLSNINAEPRAAAYATMMSSS